MPLRDVSGGGRTTVLFTLHGAECAGCLQYLEKLAPASGEFDVWDARLLVIVPEARGVPTPFGKVLADEHGRVADPAWASIVVADRYGHIFHVARAGMAHDLPPVRELEEWLKFLGTLCPE